jgi:hypothetical protein
MTFIEQLVESLDARLEQLQGDVALLTRAREQLVADRASASASLTKPRRPSRRRRRRSPARSVAELEPVDKLHGLLAKTDGLSTAALSEQANSEPGQVLPLLRQMEAAGSVRRSGQRRGTRWHAVGSEEEWIAQRAAELAARSRAV